MTEQKEEDPKEVLRKIVAEEIARAFPQKLERKETLEPDEPHEPNKHFTADLFNDHCPECQQVKKQVGEQYAQQILKERATMPYTCIGCGTGVQETEKECPACGNKKARHRR